MNRSSSQRPNRNKCSIKTDIFIGSICIAMCAENNHCEQANGILFYVSFWFVYSINFDYLTFNRESNHSECGAQCWTRACAITARSTRSNFDGEVRVNCRSIYIIWINTNVETTVTTPVLLLLLSHHKWIQTIVRCHHHTQTSALERSIGIALMRFNYIYTNNTHT